MLTVADKPTPDFPQLFAADVPPPSSLDPEFAEQMLSFRVEVTKELVAEFYILARSEAEADEMAAGLIPTLGKHEYDEGYGPSRFVEAFEGPIPRGLSVWTGGADGHWIDGQ